MPRSRENGPELDAAIRNTGQQASEAATWQ